MTTFHRKFLAVLLTVVFFQAPVWANETDSRIEEAAKNSYVFKQYLKEDSVQVNSKDGLVTLSGVVHDKNHKSLAADTVKNLPGVRNVQNNIDVQGDDIPESSDTWLALKVKTALLFHSKINPLATQVNVHEGIVTLTGDVENQARKELATEYAKDVDGVKSVRNEMVVKEPTKEEVKAKQAKAEAKEKEVKANAQTRNDNDNDEHVDDASITAQSKMALLFHRSTSALSTNVDTKDGVVTLTGKAKNQAEKELASKVVSDIRGVKSVDNKMEVTNE